MDMHDGQITVSVATVRDLIDAQFPTWRDLPITPITGCGTVNAIFRIGTQFSARFPLHGNDSQLVLRDLMDEAAAASELAGRSRFATPEPVALGEPGAGYPFPWSVQTWLSGRPATEEDPSTSTAFARDVAEFIASVRAIDARGRTFSGSGRGGVLSTHDEWVRTCLARSDFLLNVPVLQRMWDSMGDLPRGGSADVMNHGDLIPGNVLVAGGRLVGVLDVGSLGPADPALDLVSAWHLLDDAPREVLRDELSVDDAEWARGRAWAFEQAIGLVWYYVDSNPVMSRIGCRTLARLME